MRAPKRWRCATRSRYTLPVMRAIFRIVVALAVLTACPPAKPAESASADIARNSADLTAFLDAEYEKQLSFSPEDLTSQGRKDQYGLLDDRSEAAADEQLAWYRRSVADMKARFKPETLSEDARLSYEIWEENLERAEVSSRWRRNRYVFARGNATTGIPNFLINQHRVDEKSDMVAYIARVGLIDEAMDQLLVRAKAAQADGVHMPGFTYDQSLGEIRRITTGAPFDKGKDSALFADGKAKIAKLLAGKKITADEGRMFEKQLSDALTLQLKPAYDRVTAFLTEDMSRAQKPDKQGASALPGAPNYYNDTLYLSTTTHMTADEIHELGKAEVARIRGEMEKVKAAAGFKGTLEEFFVFMRTNPKFLLPDNEDGANRYLKLADGYLAGMKKRLPEYFGILPKADLIVKRVEPFREQPGGAQHYMRGAPDGSRPGIFYAHLSDMKAMPTYQLENVAYHEGLPGHHMQISIAQELTGIPKFRTQNGYSAYWEGWGLYAEALSKEMGFYSDPYSDFGRLAGENWRAIRLVVDTGIHSKGWTQRQAEDYFKANSPQPEAAIKSEIERYILNPGQATSYKIGMITIQKLRAEAQAALGGKFDIRAFHDAVLDGGALPLPVLGAKIHRWIEAQKKKESTRYMGSIDFFGLRRVSEAAVREHLPFKEGDPLLDKQHRPDGADLARAIGVSKITLAYVCCTPDQEVMVYIGVAEKPVKSPRPPVFTGAVRLPENMIRADEEFETQVREAIDRGQAAEDDSQGHALGEYPPLRAVQQQMLDFARDHFA
ncbi:MAG TPA: DUF885 domain-containing protein, partial [Hyphomonadaceae bacterium]|nr:DUF885 domain-containing protein [Hyphomonadaceae bacterium]